MASVVALSSFAAAAGVGRRSAGAAAPPRRHALVVRCQSEPKEEPPAASRNPSPAPSNPSPNPAPKRQPEVSTKFTDVLAFSGPAPERINGRLAMVGFVSAIAVEAVRGDGLFAQIGGSGLTWFLLTAAVFSAASLVPLFRGESVQAKTEGIMNESAELWNGRFAMLGIVALALTEYVKGGPLV